MFLQLLQMVFHFKKKINNLIFSVRKNRETAILSQKRKREKIEEFDSLMEKYNTLLVQVKFDFFCHLLIICCV